MEKPSLTHRHREEHSFDPGEELLKACLTRESTNSRRYSASNLTSFREEARSFRQQTNLSSTASSPGYTPKEHIDPSTYSFTAAIKALQVKSGWETVYGNPLHSKWNEAERYICNPLSGAVPLECLSAKTLSGMSFRATNRATKSASLFFSHERPVLTRTTVTHEEEEEEQEHSITEKEGVERVGRHGLMTRDVGTQSTPPYLSSSSTSPESGLSIKNTPLGSRGVTEGEPLSCHLKLIAEAEVGLKEKGEKQKKRVGLYKSKAGTCLAWGLLVRKDQRKGIEANTNKNGSMGDQKKDIEANTNKNVSMLRPWRFCAQVGGKTLSSEKGKRKDSVVITASIAT